jgi:cytochrome c556
MPLTRRLLTAALAGGIAVTSVALTASADSHAQTPPAVAARQGHMRVMALNIGVLGGMARGDADYDAEAAQTAADNLLIMTTLSHRFYWPEGTDNASIEGTRALPAIWEEGSRVGEYAGQLNTAAQGLAAAAGGGLDAMRAALGPVGNACGACHDDYRAEQ